MNNTKIFRITDEAETILEKQVERICDIFTDEDKEFNARMVEEGRKIQGKSMIPSVTENHHCNCTYKKEENDDYDFTSKVLEEY